MIHDALWEIRDYKVPVRHTPEKRIRCGRRQTHSFSSNRRLVLWNNEPKHKSTPKESPNESITQIDKIIARRQTAYRLLLLFTMKDRTTTVGVKGGSKAPATVVAPVDSAVSAGKDFLLWNLGWHVMRSHQEQRQKFNLSLVMTRGTDTLRTTWCSL